jgi:hypothetical protein
VVSVVSQFMHASCTVHLDAIDRILRYLKGTPGQEIWMKKMILMMWLVFLMLNGAKAVTENQPRVFVLL